MYTVYNTLGLPLNRLSPFPTFPEAERFALACGQRCHIRKGSDYWSPVGRRSEPLWYGGAKLGRPKSLDPGARRNVYLSDADWGTAQQLGAGNASEGIRAALSLAVAARALNSLPEPVVYTGPLSEDQLAALVKR